MAEQLHGFPPLVALELPSLACGEDGDDAGPVVWFEHLWCVDDGEAGAAAGGGVGAVGVEGAHVTRDLDHVGGAVGGECGVVGGHEEAGVEEGFDVGEPEEGGGGGGEEDDWVVPLAGRRAERLLGSEVHGVGVRSSGGGGGDGAV